jgi:hypothetical protein
MGFNRKRSNLKRKKNIKYGEGERQEKEIRITRKIGLVEKRRGRKNVKL